MKIDTIITLKIEYASHFQIKNDSFYEYKKVFLLETSKIIQS